MQSECPKSKRCKHCGKSGHVASDCWEKHPDKRPSKKDGADPVKKPFPTKGKGKEKGKGKSKGKGKRNKFREQRTVKSGKLKRKVKTPRSMKTKTKSQ